MIRRRQPTALQSRGYIAVLLAFAVIVAQLLLVAHDGALHAHHHAAECKICAHSSGSDHALPAPVLVFSSHAAEMRVLLACPNFAIPGRYQPRPHAPCPRMPC
jgi:hypothetical protein